MNNEQLVIVRDGKAVADSRTVATIFEKEHCNVLQSINNLREQLPSDFRDLNFQASQYKQELPTGGTKELPMYLLTRDAFTLLAMGFTGPKALKFKLEYIKAFNDMETALKAGDQTLHQAVEEGKASDHPVFDNVLHETFDRGLTVDDFPCLIEISGKRFIPVSVIGRAVRFKDWHDAFYVNVFCRNNFTEEQFSRYRLPRYAVLCYEHFQTSHRNRMSCYKYSLLAEECIPVLVDVLNAHHAYLAAPIKICAKDKVFSDYMYANTPREPRQPREPHPDSLADLPIGEILKLSGFELIKIFLKGLAAK